MALYSLNEDHPFLPPKGRHWIAPGAHVIGRVELGEDVGVWFGAVLRGDNEPIRIGARTNIQENVLMHTDMGFPLTVGAGCTIGHRAILHGCHVADNVLIGMGAMVLNGARIGPHSLVAAGALVTEGREFGGGALIMGSPAKIARPLSLEETARIEQSSKSYVAAWRRFASGLHRLDSPSSQGTSRDRPRSS